MKSSHNTLGFDIACGCKAGVISLYSDLDSFTELNCANAILTVVF